MALVLTGFLSVTIGPATAAPVDPGWTASGPGAKTVSDGSASAASMSYNADNGISRSASWSFTARATAAGSVKVPYTWTGLHAWFQVTTTLQAVVNGRVVGTLVQEGPADCCTSPSNGFEYGGVATFAVAAGDTYGFRLSGSNFDSNNFLHGTFTLSTKPYVDPAIGTDNRQWTDAAPLPPEGITGTLDEPGEARWFRFPVVPGQHATVDLSTLPADYDVALYGDIGAAFQQLSAGSDITQLAAASAAGAPGSETQVPVYPDEVTQVPTSATELPSTEFGSTTYAPRIYAPRIYAPRIYAPRIYAPRIYAPRIYAPDSYNADLDADDDFRNAFSAAQNQTLLAVSANTDRAPERVSASTGNTDGYFYVRVQGHDDVVSDPNGLFHLNRSVSAGSACVGLDDFSDQPTLAPTRGDARTVIVTDTNKLGLAAGSQGRATYLASLAGLAARTDGAVVDVNGSVRVQDLQAQVDGHPDCPYAVNLVARAVKEIVDSYRNDNSTYVVIAGGDDVIPFFRYPDVSGLGQESQFDPPVRSDSPSGASLRQDQVQSQDAYGSSTEVTIGGATLPVPDLSVGRLVKTPQEIESTIGNFLGLAGGTLPAPTGRPSASLVTGYDFLADAAHEVNDEFTAALPGGRHDTLIAESGTPLDQSWNADALENALLGSHHELVYLAGHFSANDTLAADFNTTLDADVLAPASDGGTHPTALENTLVLSAGCHSGYNIVDGAAVPQVTNTFDWTQRMAQQHAVLVGGTGYQYGDTDFLEYSERLYLDLARRLHEGPTTGAAPPVPIGKALLLAKQDYLASLGTVTGLDQKVVLQATLYGLPMTGFDAPGRSPLGQDASPVSPEPVKTGPGATLGLSTDDLPLATPTTRATKSSGAGSGLPATLEWLEGSDGVTAQPGAPALPKQIEDVSVPGQLLRGVGFRGGAYVDRSGMLPLTGAPAIEGSTANTTFESAAFFPQRLVTPNYFGALGSSGRTSLVLSPAQYRSDAGGASTNTERAYSGLDLRLYYSGDRSKSYSGNNPALAAAPSLGAVTGTVKNRLVTFSTQVTGDPSAGVQEVWVTWTGGPGAGGRGQWASVDLSQDTTDSTHWSGSFRLPDGQSYDGVRFVVQAANGVGAVGLDTAEGDGYRVTPEGPAPPPPAIDAATPAHGTAGVAYSTALTATGGTSPLYWGLAAGSTLPAGLTLGLDGTIEGTPTAPGSTTFTVTVTDSNGATAAAPVTIVIDAPPPPVITPPQPPAGTVGVAYRTDLVATGGAAPLTWGLAPWSTLPAGLTLSPAGVIGGTPTKAGSTTLTVTVTDKYGSTASAQIAIVVGAAATKLTATRALSNQPPLVLKATLTHARTGAPLAGQVVVFKAWRVPLCTATTNAQGIATCDLRKRPLDALAVAINLGYEVTFAATPDYLGSSGSAGL